MADRFNHPDNIMHYFVIEFDSKDCSWDSFRKEIFITNSSKAVSDSLRGKLYADYPVELPESDNFVHGSAGPLEGLIERAVFMKKMLD